MDIREVTPTSAATSGWKVEVHQEAEYVRFTVQLPEPLLAQVATAYLGIWQDRKLITSCILGLHKRRDGDRYEFALARQYLDGALFELGMKDEFAGGNVSFRMPLVAFVPQKDKGVPDKEPEATR